MLKGATRKEGRAPVSGTAVQLDPPRVTSERVHMLQSLSANRGGTVVEATGR
jgi:hypothetical protein